MDNEGFAQRIRACSHDEKEGAISPRLRGPFSAIDAARGTKSTFVVLALPASNRLHACVPGFIVSKKKEN